MGKLKRKEYEDLLEPLEEELVAMARWVAATGTLRLDPDAPRRPGTALRAYAPLNNKAMELRKMVNHPCLSYPPERGGYFEGDLVVRTCGKLWLLDRMLVKLHASGHRVLLFSTMTKLLDTLERYLDWRRLEGGYNMRHCRIDGTTPLEDREKSIGEFHTPGSDLFIFLLSIRAAGRSQEIIEKHFKTAKIQRRVALTLPHFLSLIEILPQTDLIATVPTRVAESLARNAALKVQPLPVKSPTFAVKQFWHRRFHQDPGNRWVRGVVRGLFQGK